MEIQFKILQKNLFEFNSELELVGFDDNKIFHVDPKTFDNLRNLKFFWFTKAPCISKEIYNSKFYVQKVIQMVKNRCVNLEFMKIEDEIEKLKIEAKFLSSEDFRVKLENYENAFRKSNFSKIPFLVVKLRNLRNLSQLDFFN